MLWRLYYLTIRFLPVITTNAAAVRAIMVTAMTIMLLSPVWGLEGSAGLLGVLLLPPVVLPPVVPPVEPPLTVETIT